MRLLIGVLFLTLSWSVAKVSFYSKEELKPYFSISSGYNNSDLKDINETFLDTDYPYIVGQDGNGLDSFALDSNVRRFYPFMENASIGNVSLEAGVQYKGFRTGFVLNWMATKESFGQPTTPATNININGYRPVELSVYDLNIKVGQMLFDQASFFNVIGNISFGFTFVDIKFPYSYIISYPSSTDTRLNPYTIKNKDYTSVGKNLGAGVEFRFNIHPNLALGLYAEYQMIRYDQFILERVGSDETTTNYFYGRNNSKMDRMSAGLILTYTLFSDKEKEEQ